MDENHQDNAESKLAVIEDTKWVLNKKTKLWIPKQNSTHKWRNLLARFFKSWASPIGIGTVIAVSTLLWGVISFNLQQQSAQQTETDQQQGTILQTYIDNIQDLLLNHNLLKSKSTDDVAIIARVRTLTTLRRLNAERNRFVLRFLQDAHLIGIKDAVINLSGANLSGANLTYANLSYALLSGATLNGADLSDARNLTQQQLDEVYSCTNAMLSTGLTCHHSGSIVTLTYWYNESPAETPVILQLIQQFQQQNPNIRINAVYKPFFLTQGAFITAVQAGNAPDVLRSDIGWVTQFASHGDLLKIDSYVSQSHLDLSDYLGVPLSYDKYNGHLYGLPQVTDFLALLYNRAELAKVGMTSPRALATMADFEAVAMKIVQSKAATYGFETSGGSYYALPFLWAFGGGMIDQHHILVNNAGSVAGLNFLLKLQNTDQVMPAKVDFSNGYTNMVNDFKSGETAMIFVGPYEVSNILTGSAFTGNTSNLGIAPIPMGPSGHHPRSPVGGQSYVISAGTRHPAEAYKFISFMSSMASQLAIAQANHTLPTRQSAYQNPGVSRDPFIRAFHAIQNTAIARPAIPQGGYLFEAFDPNIWAALNGAKSPTDALTAVADAWKQLIPDAS